MLFGWRARARIIACGVVATTAREHERDERERERDLAEGHRGAEVRGARDGRDRGDDREHGDEQQRLTDERHGLGVSHARGSGGLGALREARDERFDIEIGGLVIEGVRGAPRAAELADRPLAVFTRKGGKGA